MIIILYARFCYNAPEAQFMQAQPAIHAANAAIHATKLQFMQAKRNSFGVSRHLTRHARISNTAKRYISNGSELCDKVLKL